MSFVKKAVKKVIKTVKKIVKSKIFKYVVIAAAIFFTAGIAAGGFAAFGAAGPGLGGFFTAVGQTIATGASAIAGSLGFSGVSSTLAGYGGAAAQAAGLAGAAGGAISTVAIPSYVTVGTGAGQAATVAAAQVANTAAIAEAGLSAGTGFMGAVKGVMGKKILGDVTIGELASKAVLASVTASLADKGKEKEFGNPYIAGGLARGGPDTAPPAHTFEFGGTGEGAAPAPAPEGVEMEQPSVAAQMAQGGQPQADPGSRIQALIQERGPISQPGYEGTAPYAGPARGGLVAQEPAAPQVAINRPAGLAPPSRTFVDQASQMQYQPRGLV